MNRPLSIALAATLAVIQPACSNDGKGDGGGGGRPGGKQQARPFPVEVQPVASRTVAYTVTAVGTLQAYEQIQVTSRVTGVVEKVKFAEGQRVEQNQPLVEIEPRRFQLAVAAARAALAKARATAAEGKAGLDRREGATKNNPGLIPGEEIETWRTKMSTADAEVSAAKVALDRAQLDLRDAYVRAPVTGVLETRTVTTGQYVQPGTVLATLVRRDPLLLKFEIPEREAGKMSVGMPVQFGGERGAEGTFSAKLTLIATAADPASRMVDVTAEVDDPRQAELRPGTFARVTVKLGETADAVVIPQSAVRPSEKGFLAYVVADGKAVERVIDLGLRTGDDLVEVRSGLKVGEELVVRGAEALREGVPVIIRGDDAPKPGKPTKAANP